MQTAYDENVITTDSILPRLKSTSDELYESLVTGLNVVVCAGMDENVLPIRRLEVEVQVEVEAHPGGREQLH